MHKQLENISGNIITAMELPQTIKQEKVYYDETEPDVYFEKNILDSMEIKVEHIKIEPHLHVPKPNNLFQKCNLTGEAKMIGNNDKCMFNCSLNEISKETCSVIKLEESEHMEETERMKDIVQWEIKNRELNIKDEINTGDEEQRLNKILCKQEDSEIKLEGSEAIDGVEKMDEIVNVKWAIENDKVNNKEEDNFEDEEHRKVSTLDSRQESKRRTASGSNRNVIDNVKQKNHDKVNMYNCDQCDYQTVYKQNYKSHSLKHKNLDEIHLYKCDQCDYQTVHKSYLKSHGLNHKNTDEVDMYKCEQCDYQTVRKCNLKKHTLIHKKSDEVDTYTCNQCAYQTPYKHIIKQHLLQHKKPDQFNGYKCDQCDFQTIWKQNFKEHVIKHKNTDEISLYKCEQCGYHAAHKNYLKKHSLRHKNSDEVDMYKCDQCDYQTVYKENLKRHSLKHKNSNEITLYKCDQCDYQTVHKSYLKKHGLRRHKKIGSS